MQNYFKMDVDQYLDDSSPQKANSLPDASTPDPDFEANSDGSDSDFEAPNFADPQEDAGELDLSRKPKKLASKPIAQSGLVYQPPVVSENDIPAGQLNSKQTVYRSQTPVDIRERRSAMMYVALPSLIDFD